MLTLNIFDIEQDSTGRRPLRDFTNKSRYAYTDTMGREPPCKQFINYYCDNSTLSLFFSSAKSRTNLEVSVKPNTHKWSRKGGKSKINMHLLMTKLF